MNFVFDVTVGHKEWRDDLGGWASDLLNIPEATFKVYASGYDSSRFHANLDQGCIEYKEVIEGVRKTRPLQVTLSVTMPKTRAIDLINHQHTKTMELEHQKSKSSLFNSIIVAFVTLVLGGVGGYLTKRVQVRPTVKALKTSKEIDAYKTAQEFQRVVMRGQWSRKMTSIRGILGGQEIPTSLNPALADRDALILRVIQRMMFVKLYSYKGDKDVLKQALEIMAKQGYKEITPSLISRATQSLESIRHLKQIWLEDRALPAVMSARKLEEESVVQEEPLPSKVTLPNQLIVFKEVPPSTNIGAEDYFVLIAEIEWLRKNK